MSSRARLSGAKDIDVDYLFLSAHITRRRKNKLGQIPSRHYLQEDGILRSIRTGCNMIFYVLDLVTPSTITSYSLCSCRCPSFSPLCTESNISAALYRVLPTGFGAVGLWP